MNSDFENEEFESFDVDDNYVEIINKNIKHKKIQKLKYYLYIIISPLLIISLIILLHKINFEKKKHIIKRNNVTILLEDDKIKKPLTDSRKIEIIELKNGINCVLISDNNATRAGFSLNINIEGKYNLIAYLTQIILLNFTPLGQIFQILLKTNFGNKKIETNEGLSTYYFDIDNKGLEETMIALYNMIYNCPYLINNLTDDEKYILSFDIQTIKKLIDENIEIYFVNAGNNDFNILEIADMIFYPKNNIEYNIDNVINLLKSNYFNPKNIKISIISNRTLNEMEILLSIWGNISFNQFNNLNNFNPYDKKIEKTQFNKDIITKNLNKDDLFYFIIYCEKDNIYDFNSISYYEFISYILNYNGENSLSKTLIDKKLIYDLRTKVMKTSLFSPNYLVLKMHLTNEGIKSKNLIVKYIYKYFSFMNKNSDFSIPFQDFKIINNQKFLFLTIDKYQNYLNSLSKRLFYFPDNKVNNLPNILFGLYNVGEYNSKIMKSLISSLLNYNYYSFFICSPSISFSENNHVKNDYKGIKYFYKTLNENDLKNMIDTYTDDNFSLRKKNKYISNINYIEEIFGKEKDIINEINYFKPNKFTIVNQYNNINIYYRKDRTFKVPRIETYININFILFYGNTIIKKENSQDEQIYIFNKISNYIKYKLIDIEDCGNSINFEFLRNEGFNIKISSYKDQTLNIVKDVFEILKNDINKIILEGDKIFKSITYQSINEKYFDYLRSYSILEGFNIQKTNKIENRILTELVNNIINLSNIKILLYGVLTENLVNEIYDNSKIIFKQNKIFYNPIQKIINESFEKTTCFIYKYSEIFNEKDTNYLISTFKIGIKNITNEIISDIVAIIWNEKIEYYKVEKVHYADYIFLKIIKYLKSNDPDEERNILIKNEIPSIETSIQILSQTDFEYYLDKIKFNLNKKFLRLRQKANKAFDEVLSYTELYFTKEEYLNEINNLKLEQFKKIFSNHFNSNLKIFFEFFYDNTKMIKKEDIDMKQLCNISYN